MKRLIFALWLCVGAIPALAQNSQGQNNNSQGDHHAAPAPLIGAGIPVALAVGGVLAGAGLIRRRKR